MQMQMQMQMQKQMQMQMQMQTEYISQYISWFLYFVLRITPNKFGSLPEATFSLISILTLYAALSDPKRLWLTKGHASWNLPFRC